MVSLLREGAQKLEGDKSIAQLKKFGLDFGSQIITQEGVSAKTENATSSKLKIAQSVS